MCEKKEFERHLTQEDIASFHAMTLDTDALIAFAEHIEACPACAAKVAESEQEMDIHVPKGFAPEVRLRAAGGDRREFYRYSLRVCAAVCASLMLLFTGNFSYDKLQDIPAPKLEFLDKMTQSISDFSNNMIQWEGLFHGQKK
jgi:hypothetical protein